MGRKGRDSERKTRPSPSFDRVARQQSPTDEEDTRFPGTVKVNRNEVVASALFPIGEEEALAARGQSEVAPRPGPGCRASI